MSEAESVANEKISALEGTEDSIHDVPFHCASAPLFPTAHPLVAEVMAISFHVSLPVSVCTDQTESAYRIIFPFDPTPHTSVEETTPSPRKFSVVARL